MKAPARTVDHILDSMVCRGVIGWFDVGSSEAFTLTEEIQRAAEAKAETDEQATLRQYGGFETYRSEMIREVSKRLAKVQSIRSRIITARTFREIEDALRDLWGNS